MTGSHTHSPHLSSHVSTSCAMGLPSHYVSCHCHVYFCVSFPLLQVMSPLVFTMSLFCHWFLAHVPLYQVFTPMSPVSMSHYVVCRVYLVLILCVTATCTFVSVFLTCSKLYSCSVHLCTMSLRFCYCHMYLSVSFPYIPSTVFM